MVFYEGFNYGSLVTFLVTGYHDRRGNCEARTFHGRWTCYSTRKQGGLFTKRWEKESTICTTSVLCGCQVRISGMCLFSFSIYCMVMYFMFKVTKWFYGRTDYFEIDGIVIYRIFSMVLMYFLSISVCHILLIKRITCIYFKLCVISQISVKD